MNKNIKNAAKVIVFLSLTFILLISAINLDNDKLIRINAHENELISNTKIKPAISVDFTEPLIIDAFAMGIDAKNWTKAINDGWVTGEGTIDNPYLINDLVVDTNNNGTALTIRNSKSYYFTINNTVLIGGSNYNGLELFNTNNGTIENSTFVSNKNGISLQSGSMQNSISKNTINENSYGIYIGTMSMGNIIMENGIIDNMEAGITAENASSMNIIVMNYFLQNDIQAEDNSTNGNIWNSTMFGNFWDDYLGDDNNTDSIGDDPYIINDDVKDFKPIFNYPPMIIPSMNHSYVIGSLDNFINWTVMDIFYFNSSYEIYRNGLLIEEGKGWNPQEIKINVDSLEVGPYNLTLKVYDGLGAMSSNQIDLYVVNSNTGLIVFISVFGVLFLGIITIVIVRKRQ
ncbi:MAG: right-handed parallel beta-helix repeat-containing protein [Promethearchaeota archaeon]